MPRDDPAGPAAVSGPDTRPEAPSVELAFDRDQGMSERLLWARLARTTNAGDFAALWLQLQARALDGARVGVLVLGPPGRGPFLPVATWPEKARIGADLSIAAETALADRKGVLRDRAEANGCVALPLIFDDELHGVVAFEFEPGPGDALAEAGRRLQWGSGWIEVLVRRRSLLPNRQLVEVMETVATLLEAPGLSVATQALAGEVARVLGADWAAVGLTQGARVKVSAISQAITTSRRPQIMTATAATMQEALDQRTAIALPEDMQQLPRVTRAHRALADLSQAAPAEATDRPAVAVLSMPIASGGDLIGVLTVVGTAGQVFSARDRDFCALLATLAGPALDLKRRDDRWIGAKIWQSLLGLLRALVGPRRMGLKLAALALVAAAAWLSVATAPFRVTAPASVEGSIQRAVVVPIAGFIAAQQVRAGDRVQAGEVMARLDDREFKVDRIRLESERDQRLRAYRQAFAQGERDQVQALRAEIEQAQARLDLLDEQLARVELRAPIDGLVVRGDLSQMVGAPVQRGDVLFEVAPLDDFRLILRVDERDADAVREGQEGELVLSSLSSQPMRFRVTKWTPIASTEGGQSYFRVEAALEGSHPAVRPGMEGVAKIDIGRRRVIDIATARLRQWLAMTAWKYRF